MALSFSFNFGRLLAKGERLTNAKINAIVKGITASLAGSVGTTDIADGAITPAKAAPGAWFYASATLGGSTYTAAYAPTAVAGYSDGLWLCFKADLANAGAASFDAGAGAKPLRKFGGKALVTGDIKAGQIVTVRYNSSLIGGGCWELVAVPGQPVPDAWYFGLGVQTTGTYAVTLPVAPVAYSAGLRIVFQADTANTGAVLVNVNGLGAVAVQLNGAALAGNEILIGQMVPLIFDGAAFQILGSVNVTPTAILGQALNLLIQNNAGTPNTKIDLAADEVVVKSSAANAVLLGNVAVTIDAGTVGAGGLDAGGLANTTWYYVYVIWNGTAAAGLLSTSASAPTMPAGYTHKAMIGTCVTDGSAHFITFFQQDRETFINDTVIFTAHVGTVAYTALSLATWVPPIAKQAWGTVGTSVNTNFGSLQVAADGNGLGAMLTAAQSVATTLDGYNNASSFRIPLKTAQTLYCRALSTNADYRMGISGYSV